MLRLLRKSGLDGLAGMSSIVQYPGYQLQLVRPLLSVPKQRLTATCVAADQTVVKDPSNANPAFMRVRARDALAQFDSNELDMLHSTVQRLGLLRQEVTSQISNLRPSAERLPLYVVLDSAKLVEAPLWAAVRTLQYTIRTVDGSGRHSPRTKALEQLVSTLSAWRSSGACTGAATLGLCKFELIGTSDVIVSRERRRDTVGTLSAGAGWVPWGNQFEVKVDGLVGDHTKQFHVRQLQQREAAELSRVLGCEMPKHTNRSHMIRCIRTVPVLACCDTDRVMAVPTWLFSGQFGMGPLDRGWCTGESIPHEHKSGIAFEARLRVAPNKINPI